MKKQVIILIFVAILAILTVKPIKAEWMVVTYGSGAQDGGMQIGDNWLIQYNTESGCAVTWTCSAYGGCNMTDGQSCLAVTDTNGCGTTYNGTMSEFMQECGYCQQNPLLQICSGWTSQMYLLIIIPLILGFFCILGAATLGKEHDIIKIGLFLLSMISVTAALYLGSVIVGTTNPEVQAALGKTTYWIGWLIIVLIIYFLLYLFYKLVQTIGKNKEEKLEY